ncbi:BrnA antitoxin family protein [Opitutales bacterium]|jgi:hypothetical protein|nr:BrnA antitoxin family protein [Opitutales bacterium]MDB3958700.1 BrnA antitoxin family protein [Opitutales bacterium]
MKTEKFDQLFDAGKSDIIENLDLGSASRPGFETKRVNVDFPNWVVDQLDLQATKLGVPRQSLIKIWIADRLKQEKLA